MPQHNLDFYWYLKNLYSIFVILCSSKYKSTNLNSAECPSLCGQKTVLPESWERPETTFIGSYLMLANIGSVTRLWIASWKVHKLSALLMVVVACICLWGKYYRLERNYQNLHPGSLSGHLFDLFYGSNPVTILHLMKYAVLERFACMLETFQGCWDLEANPWRLRGVGSVTAFFPKWWEALGLQAYSLTPFESGTFSHWYPKTLGVPA